MSFLFKLYANLLLQRIYLDIDFLQSFAQTILFFSNCKVCVTVSKKKIVANADSVEGKLWKVICYF